MMNKKLGLYIHIPFCNKVCPYCDFHKMVASDNLKEKYIKALIKELKLKGISKYDLSTLYIGGGTPSSLKMDLLEMLFSSLNNEINLKNLLEFTFECNPEDISKELLTLLKKYHITRLSIGIQTLNESFQHHINRMFSDEKLSTVVNLLNECGFENYSFDLMYGFLNQTISDIKSDIDKLVSLNPKHISIYSLIVEDHTIFGKLMRDGMVLESSDEEQAKEYLFIIDYLKKFGYHQYETSNFAKMGFESKHNLIYWDHDEYLCLGSGASSFIDDVRSVTTTSIHNYINNLNNDLLPDVDSELLDFEDITDEFVMMALRKNKGIDTLEFYNKFGVDIYEYYPNVSYLLDNDIIEQKSHYLSIKKEFRYVANSVIVKFISDF
ncbi:MAG: radical SAM family heme chaperone HemW [Erysipelotrichaceae bacterium]|nr:radical SAM family heme chaperone HemW [Erysipelotrichaceae bacterium]